jgi:hypothetical protein
LTAWDSAYIVVSKTESCLVNPDERPGVAAGGVVVLPILWTLSEAAAMMAADDQPAVDAGIDAADA